MANEVLELLFKIQTQGQENLDRVVASVSKIGGAVQNQSQQIRALEQEIEHLGKGLKRTGDGADEAGKNFAGLADKVRSGIQAPIATTTGTVEQFLSTLGRGGAVTAAAGVGFALLARQAFDLVAQMGAAAEQTINFADRLGIGVGEAERLQVAAEIAGVNIGALEGATKLLSAALDDQTGLGERTANALRRLGVSTVTVSGQQREMGSVLLEVLERLSHVRSDSERVALAQQTLGRGAKEILPLIKNYAELKRTLAELGIGLNENLTRNLANADDEIGKLKASWGQFMKLLAGKIAPVVIEIIPKVGRGKGVLTPQDLERMGVRVPDRFRPLSREQAFDAAADLGFYSPERTAAEGRRRIDQLMEFADQQADLARGRAGAERFRASRASSEEGQKQRLQQVQKELAELTQVLSSSGLGGGAFTRKKAEYDRLESEARTLEAQIKAATERASLIARLPELEKQSRLAGLTAMERLNVEQEELLKKLGPGFDKRVAEIFRNPRGVEIQKLLADGRKELARGVKESEQETARLLADGAKQFSEQLKERIDNDRQALHVLKETLNVFAAADRDRLTRLAGFDMRAAELVTGPGGEESATERVYQRRLKLADDLFEAAKRQAKHEEDAAQRGLALTRARAEYESEIDSARLDRELKLLEFRKKALDEYREAAGRVWDALTTKGSDGLRSFFDSQVKTLQRQVFVNLSGKFFETAGSAVGGLIPGQRDAGGNPTFLGSILAGTIFDSRNASPLERSTDRNTKATEANTKAIERHASAVIGASASGSVPGMVGVTYEDLLRYGSDTGGFTGQGGGVLSRIPGLGKLYSGGKSSAGLFAVGLTSPFLAGAFSGLRGGDYSVTLPDGTATTASALGLTSTAARVGNVAASGATLAAGTYGVISGIREGGARGATTAVGSALGMASMIPGPQQPFLQAAALVAGLVRGMFPNPKEEFAREQQELLNSRRHAGPESQTRTVDVTTGGDLVDYDWRGRTRVIVQRTVQVNINAMDARSIEDRGDEIAKAVAKQVDAGHPIGNSIQQVIFGAT